MFCAQCGNKTMDGARFCAECGSPVAAPETLATAQPTPVQPQASAPQPNPVIPPPQSFVPPPRPPQPSYAPPPPVAPSQPVYSPPPAAPPQPSYAPPAPVVLPQPSYAPPPVAQPRQPFVPPSAQPPQPGYGYPQEPYQPAAAAPGRPGFAAQTQISTASGPMPPDMHWAVVLILSGVTCGLGGLLWSFKEVYFVKKIDPSSKCVMMLMISFLAMLAQIVVYFMVMNSGSIEAMASASTIVLLLNLVIIVTALIAVFGMRSSLVRYYNSVENIGLKLSGAMTFFFSILYFQYHFSRIVEMKKRGA